MTDKTKRTLRLLPCPAYDVEGLESYLAEQAQNGLHLCPDGIWAGFALFSRGCPRRVSYRLEAAPKSTSLWADNGGRPDDEAIALAEKYGWSYVAKRGSFFVFRSDAADARELNTDPAVQAIALDAVRRRERAAVVSSLFWALVYPVIAMRGHVLLTMIQAGTIFILLGLALLLWQLVTSIARAFHLGRLRRKLLEQGALDHRRDWRRRAARYRVSRVLRSALAVVWAVWLLVTLNTQLLEANALPLTLVSEPPPFATLADFAPDGVYRASDIGRSNTVREWHDCLAPRSIRWQEAASIRLPDSSTLAGGLYVDYHETASPWLARALMREYRRQDRLWFAKIGGEQVMSAADEVFFFQDELELPTILVRYQNKVMRVLFFQTSDSSLPLETWIAIMVDSLMS